MKQTPSQNRQRNCQSPNVCRVSKLAAIP